MTSVRKPSPTLEERDDRLDPATRARRQVLTRRRVLAAGAGVVGLAALARIPGATAAPVVVRVAAVDATAAEKSAADHRCDGTNDDAEIKAALAALPLAAGGIIQLSSGHFNMGANNVKIENRTDVQINGAGMDVTFVQNNTSVAKDLEPFSYTHADRSQVRDMTIAALGPARSTSDALDFDDCDDVVVERVRITASRGRGIVFDGKVSAGQTDWHSLRNIVRDCIVTGSQGAGIEFLAGEDCQVINCVSYGNSRAGLTINRQGSTGRVSNRISVTGGEFRNNGEDGITITESNNSVIDGALCRNNTRDGIRIQTTGTYTLPANGNQVRNCTCTDDRSTKTQVYGIRIQGNPTSEINGTVIENNNLCGNKTGGLRDGGTDTLICGNTCATNNCGPVVTPTNTPTRTATATNTPTAVPGGDLFADGFETGDLSAWTSVTSVVAQQAERAAGSWGARATSTGSPAHAYKGITQVSEAYYRLRFKLLGPAPSGVYLLRYRTGTGASLMGLFVNSSGRLAYRNDVSAVTSTSAVAVSADVWHEVQVHALVAGASGLLEVWYDGSPVPALTKTENLGTTNIGRAQIGDNASGKTFDVAFDDVLVSTAFIPYSGTTSLAAQAKSSDAGSTPTSTPTETPTKTPKSAPPTNTPEPTNAPTEAPPDPTNTPEPTNEPTEAPPTATTTPTEAPPTPTETPTEAPPTPESTKEGWSTKEG